MYLLWYLYTPPRGPFQKDFENLGDFRQKDFEEKNILCIFAPNCNINK